MAEPGGALRVGKDMVPFAIVADVRTGSTLLSTSLDRHPQVRCYGELFHPQDLPDNGVEGVDRGRSSAATILGAALRRRHCRARGFKAMAFLPLPGERRWHDAWERLRAVPGLRVLWLTRRNRLAQYASLEVARHTGVFHPHNHDRLYDAAHRPTVRLDPAEFHAWVEERDALLARRRCELDGLASLELDYETLTRDWHGSFEGVQAFLEVDALPIEPMKSRQESRPLAEVIRNYEELASAAPDALIRSAD